VGTAVEAWATLSTVVVLARVEEAATVSIFILGVWGGEVAWPSKRGKIRQSAFVAWARGGQEGSTVGRVGYPGQCIFGPKSEAEMGARGHLWTMVFVWVAPLGQLLCLFRSAR
jgi:hypothetical protein